MKETIKLTAREIEFAKFVAAGNKTKAIAKIWYRSNDTARTHRENILRKTKTANFASALTLLYQNNIIDPNEIKVIRVNR